MLDYVICHPQLSSHSTTKHFLSANRVHTVPIMEQTKLNIAIMLEHIYQSGQTYSNDNANPHKRTHDQLSKLSMASNDLVYKINQSAQSYHGNSSLSCFDIPEFTKECKKLGAALSLCPEYLTIISTQYQQVCIDIKLK